MPLFFQQDIDPHTKLAVWMIEEEEGFFLKQVPLQREITHPHKRLQHLAGRYLLRYLFADFPIELIQVADTRKPYLEDEAYHFSVSHCGDYAAVIVSKTARVGLDIELATEKIGRIRHKFVSAAEQAIVEGSGTEGGQGSLLTLLWSCKEAAFKWYGLGNVDFRKHMQVHRVSAGGNGTFRVQMRFKKNEDRFIDLHSRFFNSLCMSYVVT